MSKQGRLGHRLGGMVLCVLGLVGCQTRYECVVLDEYDIADDELVEILGVTPSEAVEDAMDWLDAPFSLDRGDGILEAAELELERGSGTATVIETRVRKRRRVGWRSEGMLVQFQCVDSITIPAELSFRSGEDEPFVLEGGLTRQFVDDPDAVTTSTADFQVWGETADAGPSWSQRALAQHDVSVATATVGSSWDGGVIVNILATDDQGQHILATAQGPN